jgi:hypothetical protein
MLIDHIRLVIREIVDVTDELYQEKLNQGYNKLNNTLSNIINLADELFALSKENKIEFNEQRFLGNLTNAMKAMEEKDTVLLADILVYDISRQLLEIIE